jgi:predicted site-specific integrase-resolvase
VPRPARLLTTSQAAETIGIARTTLSRYVAEGKLRPTLRLPSGHMRWDPEDLRAQLRALDPTDPDR